MKIKFIKPFQLYAAGDISDMDERVAILLVDRGVAGRILEKVEIKRKRKKKRVKR